MNFETLVQPTEPDEYYINNPHYDISEEWNLWEYGATPEEDVLIDSNSSKRVVPASGDGMSEEEFFTNYSEMHHANLAKTIVQVFPYIDLWMQDRWNWGAESLIP